MRCLQCYPISRAPGNLSYATKMNLSLYPYATVLVRNMPMRDENARIKTQWALKFKIPGLSEKQAP